MHARIGRISFSPDKVGEVERHVREQIIPHYEESDGFKGFTLLVDRSGGEAAGISFWESEDAMEASAKLGDEARRGAAEAGSGSDQGPQHFEVIIETTV